MVRARGKPGVAFRTGSEGGLTGAARLEGGWRYALWSLGGGRSEAAGLEDAVWVLGL